MSARVTLYQRLFYRDLFLLPIGYQASTTIMRRHCSNRICLLSSVLLAFYIGWYIFISRNRTLPLERNPAEELAYKHAIDTSSPIIQNTQICSLDEVDLLLIIISPRSHFLERQSIRETWGSMPDIFNVHSQRLFAIGYQPGDNSYKDLLNEAAHEQDLLYLTADDDSITLKEVHTYRWLEKHCSNVKYTFKTEDDLFVNSLLLHELVKELKTKPKNVQNRYLYNISLDSLFLAQKTSDTNKFLFGWAYQPTQPERSISMTPYYVSYEEYPQEKYPGYCSGFGYLMDSKTRNVLTTEAFKDKHPFRFSDIFITGILPERLSFACNTLPFTFYQGTADQCIDMITNSNKKNAVPYSPPLVVCSTGRHTGQNSFSDYDRIWATLQQVYADKLHSTNN